MARCSKKDGSARVEKEQRRSVAMEKRVPQPPPQVANATNGATAACQWPSPPSNFSPHGRMDPRPPGGFMNYLQSQQYPPLAQQYPAFTQSPENFHFVEVPAQYATFTPATSQGSPVVATGSGTPCFASQQPHDDSTDVDVEEKVEPTRTDKRLTWTHQEDVRLASAWVENSNDPINGNCKKNDQYWSEVVAAYNRTTPSDRGREASQLKIRFHRVSTKISNFNACYIGVKQVYVSGRSDKEVIADAPVKYENQHKEPFKLLHWWEVLKNEPKWNAYCEMLTKQKVSTSPLVALDAGDLPRPEGNRAAKDRRNGKRKLPELAQEMKEELDKFVAAQATTKENRDGMKEFQLRLSSERLEAAKFAQQAEKERKMLDAYKELLLTDTSGMNDDEKAQRMRALKFMSL